MFNKTHLFPSKSSFAYILLLGVASLLITILYSSSSNAAFNAGNIIADGVFTNYNTMNASQIQQFLNQKNSVCLKDFRSQSLVDDNGDGVVQDSTTETYGRHGTMSAAELIAAAARIYRINPQVILVTLQKEQGLITRTDCPDWRYNTALGYGCPDSAPCDNSAFGFTRQIDYGAYHFRGYFDDSLNYVPFGVGTYNIGYNPNPSCGSSNVYIQNRATASLYSYTPYQPNAAALAAGYGEAPCGAYGNRNFYLYFTEWFGDPQGQPYTWEWAGQYAYTDASKTTQRDLGAMRLGERAYVSVRARNIGTATWTNSGANPVRIGTTSPANRDSIFSPFSGWLGPSRPAQLQEASVAPGETGTFNFWITANATGLYNERFNLLSEGRAWFNDLGLSFGVGVVPDIYSWAWNSQYAYTDDTKTTPRSLSNLRAGERVYVGFTARNTGNITWTNTGTNPVRVGTAGPNERTSTFSDFSGWMNNRRPALMKEASVPPGGIGTFEFWITANNLGTFNERFNLLSENKTWFNDLGLSYGIGVRPDNYSWAWNSQYAYTDDTKTTPKNLQSLRLGERAFVGVTAKNTGNVPWTNSGANPVRIGTAGPNERTSTFSDFSGWIINNRRPVALKETSVNPGAVGTFEFWVTGNALGDYNEKFNLLAEDRTWFNDLGLSYGIKVNP